MRPKTLLAVLFLALLGCGRVNGGDAGADEGSDGASGGRLNTASGGQTGSGGSEPDALAACRYYLSQDTKAPDTMLKRELTGRPVPAELTAEACGECPELIAECAAVGQCYGGYCIDNDCSKGLDCTPGGYCLGAILNHFTDQGWHSLCPGQEWPFGGAGGAD